MAKKYRLKKDKNDIVTVVFAGWGKAGRWEYNGDEYLKGLTPQAHCAQKIQERGEGFFKQESVSEDVCYLVNPTSTNAPEPEISYHYKTCEEMSLR